MNIIPFKPDLTICSMDLSKYNREEAHSFFQCDKMLTKPKIAKNNIEIIMDKYNVKSKDKRSLK